MKKVPLQMRIVQLLNLPLVLLLLVVESKTVFTAALIVGRFYKDVKYYIIHLIEEDVLED